MTDYISLVTDMNLSSGTELVAWDKDSTLGDTLHRQHMLADVKNKKATWEQYSLACAGDTPFPGAVRLMQMLPYRHVVISGASEAARPVIMEWLRTSGFPVTRLILRPEGNHAPNQVFKTRVIQAMLHAGLRVRLLVEDYPEAAKMVYAKTGVPVVVVNPCYPATAPHQNPVTHEAAV